MIKNRARLGRAFSFFASEWRQDQNNYGDSVNQVDQLSKGKSSWKLVDKKHKVSFIHYYNTTYCITYDIDILQYRSGEHQ